MSVVPGLPQRTARPPARGAVIIPFPVPPTGSRHRPGSVRRPVRRPVVPGSVRGLAGATGSVRTPLRLTRRGRIVVGTAALLVAAGLLIVAAVLASAYRI